MRSIVTSKVGLIKYNSRLRISIWLRKDTVGCVQSVSVKKSFELVFSMGKINR